MLNRIRANFEKRPEDSETMNLQSTWFYYNRNIIEENDGDGRDDTSSIYSVSTNATMDNIPGTGRVIDTHFYQFFGRKLERFIFRMSMASLHPYRILEYLWMDVGFITPPFSRGSLSEVIYELRIDANMIGHTGGGERIAGLKSLVKQCQ